MVKAAPFPSAYERLSEREIARTQILHDRPGGRTRRAGAARNW